MQFDTLYSIHDGGQGLVCLDRSPVDEYFLRPESIANDKIADRFDRFSLARFTLNRQRNIAELKAISAVAATLKPAPAGAARHAWERTTDPADYVADLLRQIDIDARATVARYDRDIQIILPHCHLPRQAAPRWKALQRYFTGQLAPHGAVADLRITQMLPAGEVVGTGERMDFESLCGRLLPLSRDECRDKKTNGRARPGWVAELWWRRLQEIREWCRACWPAGVPPELRQRLLWIMTNALGWSVAEPSEIPGELVALAHEIAPGIEQWQIDGMTAGIRERLASDRDERLYRFSDEELAEHLTRDMSAQNAAAWHEIYERDFLTRQSRRGKKSVQVKAEVLQADERYHKARELRQNGMSVRRIGKELGVPKSTVADWTKYDK